MATIKRTQPLLIGFLGQLNERRKSLGMTYRILAKNSGVGIRTVQRVLSGDGAAANFRTVAAIATALDSSIRLEGVDVNEVRKHRAEQKAKRLVSMVQGTSALEAQAIDEDAMQRLRERTVKQLLMSTNARLWDD